MSDQHCSVVLCRCQGPVGVRQGICACTHPESQHIGVGLLNRWCQDGQEYQNNLTPGDATAVCARCLAPYFAHLYAAPSSAAAPEPFPIPPQHTMTPASVVPPNQLGSQNYAIARYTAVPPNPNARRDGGQNRWRASTSNTHQPVQPVHTLSTQPVQPVPMLPMLSPSQIPSVGQYPDTTVQAGSRRVLARMARTDKTFQIIISPTNLLDYHRKGLHAPAVDKIPMFVDRAKRLGLSFQVIVRVNLTDSVYNTLNDHIHTYMQQQGLVLTPISSETQTLLESRLWTVALPNRTAQNHRWTAKLGEWIPIKKLKVKELLIGVAKYAPHVALDSSLSVNGENELIYPIIVVPRVGIIVGPFAGGGHHFCLMMRLWSGMDDVNLANTGSTVYCIGDCVAEDTVPASSSEEVGLPILQTSTPRRRPRPVMHLQIPDPDDMFPPTEPGTPITPSSPSSHRRLPAVEGEPSAGEGLAHDEAEAVNALLLLDDEPDDEDADDDGSLPTVVHRALLDHWESWVLAVHGRDRVRPAGSLRVTARTSRDAADALWQTCHSLAHDLEVTYMFPYARVGPLNMTVDNLSSPDSWFRVGEGYSAEDGHRLSYGNGVRAAVIGEALKLMTANTRYWMSLAPDLYTPCHLQVTPSTADLAYYHTCGLLIQLIIRWEGNILPISPFIVLYLMKGSLRDAINYEVLESLDEELLKRFVDAWPSRLEPLDGPLISGSLPAITAASWLNVASTEEFRGYSTEQISEVGEHVRNALFLGGLPNNAYKQCVGSIKDGFDLKIDGKILSMTLDCEVDPQNIARVFSSTRVLRGMVQGRRLLTLERFRDIWDHVSRHNADVEPDEWATEERFLRSLRRWLRQDQSRLPRTLASITGSPYLDPFSQITFKFMRPERNPAYLDPPADLGGIHIHACNKSIDIIVDTPGWNAIMNSHWRVIDENYFPAFEANFNQEVAGFQGG